MIGCLELIERGGLVRIGLSESLVWEGEHTGYVRLLSEVCPAPRREEGDEHWFDVEQCGRHMLYTAAQRLGARVVLRHERQCVSA